MDFENLIISIKKTHDILLSQTVKAVNYNLTIRNWIIGLFIVEFEQNGSDRAKYGEKLLNKLAESISIKGLSETNLKNSRQFYQTYPQIGQLLTDQLPLIENTLGAISQLSTDKSNIAKYNTAYMNDLISNISFTHFVELLKIEDSLKRQFYEKLILKTQLSVKELKRQIVSLSYERLGFSLDKNIAYDQLKSKITPQLAKDAIKSHYFFDFLGIKKPDLIEESELENSLINHLQDFILELGNGFCFEARQKRILIGDEYFFVDLVFYHRILKCHVIIELKVDSFSHSHVSQLITYLNYYKSKIMESGDNPPVGILLVTDKNNALVEYATANEKDRIFVSKYKLILPSEEELKKFIEEEINL
ncbi:MAG: PDDEXK nuclease domain-containing protein [Candidatus Cloacimonetes bacterium]|nr:PDDEXK nuclease domain-containing protein [Candidatus Cloacimonadota bacterium]